MSRKPRVLLISAKKAPLICGIADYTSMLAGALRDRGIEIKHLGLDREWASPRLNGLRLLPALAKETLDDWDLIHLQYEAFSYGQSYLLPLYLAAQNHRLVVTFHEVFQRNSLERRRDRALAQGARARIVNDRRGLEALQTLASGRNVHCIGVGSNLPPPANPVPPRPGLIGYFGFLNAVKNVQLLVDVFANLARQDPKRAFLLIGAIDRGSHQARALEEEIRNRGLTEKIEWTGSLTPEAAAARIAACEVLLLPFTDGASPRRGSLQACLAAGKALVTTPPMFAEPLLDGLRMLPLDVSLWTEAVDSILRNSDLRRSLEGKALEISTNFSWKAIAERHESLYLPLIKKP